MAISAPGAAVTGSAEVLEPVVVFVDEVPLPPFGCNVNPVAMNARERCSTARKKPSMLKYEPETCTESGICARADGVTAAAAAPVVGETAAGAAAVTSAG